MKSYHGRYQFEPIERKYQEVIKKCTADGS